MLWSTDAPERKQSTNDVGGGVWQSGPRGTSNLYIDMASALNNEARGNKKPWFSPMGTEVLAKVAHGPSPHLYNTDISITNSLTLLINQLKCVKHDPSFSQL